MRAATSGNVKMISILLEEGLDVNSVSDTGMTPLLFAAQVLYSTPLTLPLTLIELVLLAPFAAALSLVPTPQAQDVQMVEFLLMSGAVNNRFTELGRSVVDLLGQEVILDNPNPNSNPNSNPNPNWRSS